VRSVGVQGDGRSYGHPVVLRPVTSEDAMTADWAGSPTTCWPGSHPGHQRVPEVNRVVLDVNKQAPAPSSGSNLPKRPPFPPRLAGTRRTQSQGSAMVRPEDVAVCVRAARQTSVKRVVSAGRRAGRSGVR